MGTENTAGTNAAPPSTAEGQVFVVRLDGNQTNPATARAEGQGFLAGDVGNSFTLNGDYVSYAAQWLGDTEVGAVLEWNGVAYVAGAGNGTAGYANAGLPGLSPIQGVTQTDDIALTAQAGAFVEFRFRRA